MPGENVTLHLRLESGAAADPIAYRIVDYSGKLSAQGELRRIDPGQWEIALRPEQGFFEIELPKGGQRFGVVSLPEWKGDPDPFFAIDGALSWLERDAARREGLRVSEGGRKLAFSPEHETGDRRTALYLERVNQQGKIIDFGPVRTDGSVLIEREGSQWVARDLSPRPGLHVAPGRKPVWPAGRDPLRRWSRPVNRTNPRGCVLEAPPAWCQPVQVERSLTAEFGKPRASGYPRQSPPPGQKPR
jgi:hypothetical protein